MKVLMTVDAVGGVWNYAAELCAALADAEVEFLLACMGPEPSAAQREIFRTLRHVRIECADYRLEWMPEPWRDVERAGDWLLKLTGQFKPDLVHLNGYVHATLPWHRPVLVAAHSCVLSWWKAVYGQAAPREWKIYREKVTAGLRAADHIVAPSATLLAQLKQVYGRMSPASTIYNARSWAPDSTEARQHFVASAGRIWDEAKNIRVLNAAAEGLAWPVYIAGDHSGPNQTMPHYAGVQLLGALSSAELARLLDRASIYASPALYEPFGLAVLEAAMAGCALVLSDIPTFRELWNGAAVFVPAHDARAWRRALDELIDAPMRLRHFATAARLRAAHFTPERMGEAYYSLYRRLAVEWKHVDEHSHAIQQVGASA